MQLYDEFNRPIGLASSTWLPNLTFKFLDVSTNIRIKHGKLQLLNETDGKWYTLNCRTVETDVNLYLSDVGESS